MNRRDFAAAVAIPFAGKLLPKPRVIGTSLTHLSVVNQQSNCAFLGMPTDGFHWVSPDTITPEMLRKYFHEAGQL